MAETPFEPPAFVAPVFDEHEEDDEFDDELDEDGDIEADNRGAVEHGLADDSANFVSGGIALAVLEHAARSLVDDPDSVIVEASPARSGVKLSLHVAPDDMGRVIGRRGRVAQALRTLVRAAAAKDGTEASVDIVD